MNAAHTRYAIPLALEPRLILRSDSGAEAWGLWKGITFAGRIERPGSRFPVGCPGGCMGPMGSFCSGMSIQKFFRINASECEMSSELVNENVLRDRRDNLKQLFERTGGDYETRIAPIRAAIREGTLDGGDLQQSYARLVLVAARAKGDDWRTIDEMEWGSALLDCLEAAEVPTAEKLAAAEAQAPVKAGKGRKGKGAGKVKAPTIAWAHKIGRNGSRLMLPGPKTMEDFEMWLSDGAFSERAVVEERNAGPCTIGYAGGLDFSVSSAWKFGDYVVFGWRVDRRKVPAGTLLREVEKKIREEEKASGKRVGKQERKAIKGEVRQALLSRSLVETTVYTVLVAPLEAWALVDGPPQVVEEVRLRLAGGTVRWPITQSVPPVILARLAADAFEGQRTDLRQPRHDNAPQQGEEKGEIAEKIFCDYLLWMATPGTSRRSRAWELGERVGWKLSGGPVKLRVPVASTSNGITLEDADSAAFTASLSEGGRIMGCRVAVEDRREVEAPKAVDGEAQAEVSLVHTYYLTFEVISGSKTRAAGMRIHSMGLPTLKGGDSAAALVFERVELLKRLWAVLEAMFRAFASDRCQDWQATIDAARTWVGLELRRRFAFDPQTGQGWLFAPVEQQVLQIEDKNAEAPAKKRHGGGKK